MNPTVIANIEIDVSQKEAFEYIVPIDLSRIFKGYRNLPAVVKTDESEKWIKPGLERTVFFEDGSTAKEKLLEVNNPDNFSYKVNQFTSPLKHLAKQINGRWEFSKGPDLKTKIHWQYEIVPKHFFAKMIINGILKSQINHILTNALQIIREDLQK